MALSIGYAKHCLHGTVGKRHSLMVEEVQEKVGRYKDVTSFQRPTLITGGCINCLSQLYRDRPPGDPAAL
jgi:hypothetical protein